MHLPQLIQIESLDSLRQRAGAWDDLWSRSAATIPTLQAALIAQWVETFGQGCEFRALAVEQQGRLIAALPLIGKRLGGLMSVGMMPNNEWTPASDLLLDEQADVAATLDLLVSGIAQLPWSLLWLDACLLDQPRWHAWRAACQRAGLSLDEQARFRIARTEIDTAWEAYRQSWSRNHRRNMQRYRRKLTEDHGIATLRLLRPSSSAELGGLLRRGFEIEDRSWKGAAGTSVLRSPGAFTYYVKQAELLAERGQLEIAYLDLAGQPIAFQYAWSAKGVYHPFKIGYDETFAEYGPGQLLMHDVLERSFQTGSHCRLDCVGPLSDATGKWKTTEYTVGRMIIAPRRFTSQTLLYVYRHLWPTLRRWRGGIPPTALPADELAEATQNETIVLG